MALGRLLRKAAAAADSATESVGGALTAAKDRAANLTKGDNAEVYDNALTDVADALTDSGLMTPQITSILGLLAKGNPYK